MGIGSSPVILISECAVSSSEPKTELLSPPLCERVEYRPTVYDNGGNTNEDKAS